MYIQTSSQFTRHPNADAIIAYVNDTSLPVFYWNEDKEEWIQTLKPNWNPQIPHYTGIERPFPLIDFNGYKIHLPLPCHTIINGDVYKVVLCESGFCSEKISGETKIISPFYHLTLESAQLHADALNALCGVSNV